MSRPETSQYPRPATPLAEVYASSYGSVGSYDIVKSQDPRNAASVALGKACFAIISDRPQYAKGQIQKAKSQIRTIPDGKDRQGQEARTLRDTASLLSLRNQPAAIDRLRVDMQGWTIEEITRLMRQKPHGNSDRSADVRGQLNEQTTLGVLNRYNHPWMMAVAALHFQDNFKGAENCDGILVESLPELTECIPGANAANTYKYQVKSRCLGFCGKLLDESEQAQADKTFAQYTNNIRLISGCCDLQVDVNSGRVSKSFPVAALLINEAEGKATPDEIAQLDDCTNGLLLALTGDESRRGRALAPEILGQHAAGY